MGSKALRKVALVTGASRGVGFAAANPSAWTVETETCICSTGRADGKKICSSFPDSSIYLTTKNQQITAGLNAAMRKEFGDGSSNCQYIHLDIDNKDSVAEAAAVIGAECGNLDILINNAGVYAKPNKDEFGRQAEAILNTNYFGLKNVMEAMRPLLVLAEGGRVVNMSSHLGHLSHINGNIHGAKELRIRLGNTEIAEKELDGLVRDFVAVAKLGTWKEEGWPTCAYSVSKVAVNVYTRILQRTFDSAMEDVTVNSLHPGTPHSKIHQIGVISLEEGAKAVAECALGPARGHRGQVLWHNLEPIHWEAAVHTPSIID